MHTAYGSRKCVTKENLEVEVNTSETKSRKQKEDLFLKESNYLVGWEGAVYFYFLVLFFSLLYNPSCAL